METQKPSEEARGHKGQAPLNQSNRDVENIAFELYAYSQAEEIENMSIEEIRAELERRGVNVNETIQRIRQRLDTIDDRDIIEA